MISLGTRHGNVAATQIRLSVEELHPLDEVSRLPSEYPGWTFERRRQISESVRG